MQLAEKNVTKMGRHTHLHPVIAVKTVSERHFIVLA